MARKKDVIDPIEEEIHETLKKVRSSNDYSGEILLLKRILGINPSEDDDAISSMLIYTADKMDNTLNRDAALMALGLLRGFERKEKIGQRRERFIRTSSFVEDLYDGSNKKRGINSLHSPTGKVMFASEDDLASLITALNTDDGDALGKLARQLFARKKNMTSYLEEAKGQVKKKGGVVYPDLINKNLACLFMELIAAYGAPEGRERYLDSSDARWKHYGFSTKPSLDSFLPSLVAIIEGRYDKYDPSQSLKRDLLLLQLSIWDDDFGVGTLPDKGRSSDALFSKRYDLYIKNGDFPETFVPTFFPEAEKQPSLQDEINLLAAIFKTARNEIVEALCMKNADTPLESFLSTLATEDLQTICPCYTKGNFPQSSDENQFIEESIDGSDDEGLCGILQELCNKPDKARCLLQSLESIPDNEFDYPLEFCQSYIIELLKTFCKTEEGETVENERRHGSKEDKVEFMLAMFGLLKGFEFSSGNAGERSMKYYKYASKYSSLFIDTDWDDQSADTMCCQIANTISVELVHSLTEEKKVHDGKLCLLDEVPEKLELPSPKERKPQPDPAPPPDPPPANPAPRSIPWPEKIGIYLKSFFAPVQKAAQNVTKRVSSSQVKPFIIAGCVMTLVAGFVVIAAQFGNKDISSDPYDTDSSLRSQILSSISDASITTPSSPNMQALEPLEYDMSDLIQEAQSPLVADLDAGEYTVDDLRELICKRILSNPIYGDMVANGFIDADSHMKERIGESNGWLYDFIEETRIVSKENQQPNMSHWLKEYGGQLFTTDEYKQYANLLCEILRSFTMEENVRDFVSTNHWVLGQDNAGIHAYMELASENCTQPAIVFRKYSLGNEFDYEVAFFTETGSFAIQNRWLDDEEFTFGVKTGSISAGWGDSGGGRPSYTIEEINAGVIDDKIIFNTISNGTIGHEKNFVSARPEDAPNEYEGNQIAVEDGKEYRIRLYVHNNSRFGEDAVAENVRVAFNIPQQTVVSRNLPINGFIYSDNASPDTYWDGVVLTAGQNFHVEYVEGSAQIENNGFASKENGGAKALSDEIVMSEEGVLIGYDDLDGRIPGCFQYSQIITLRVKVVFDPEYLIESKVRILGEEDWSDDVEVNVGNILEFRVRYKNLSPNSATHESVMLKNYLPEGLHYIEDSGVLYIKGNVKGVPIELGAFTDSGVNIGNFDKWDEAYIQFKAEVIKDGLADGFNRTPCWSEGNTNQMSISDYCTVTVPNAE